MRDRLIELIEEAHRSWLEYVDECAFNQTALSFTFEQMLADHLLAEGVIVPPCKMGQTVYVPWAWGDQEGIANPIVECIQIVRDTELCGFFIDMKSDDVAFNDVYGFWRTFADIGKKIFLTREEAEAALERSENGKS